MSSGIQDQCLHGSPLEGQKKRATHSLRCTLSREVWIIIWRVRLFVSIADYFRVCILKKKTLCGIFFELTIRAPSQSFQIPGQSSVGEFPLRRKPGKRRGKLLVTLRRKFLRTFWSFAHQEIRMYGRIKTGGDHCAYFDGGWFMKACSRKSVAWCTKKLIKIRLISLHLKTIKEKYDRLKRW